MKKPGVIAREKIHAARQWVFRWRGLDGTPLRGILAILMVTGMFSLFAVTVHIRVSAPQQWVEKKASIIHLTSAGEGEMWALRAKEAGPFPSRLDPAEWESSSALAGLVAKASRLSSKPYQPTLRDLPQEDLFPPVPVAPKGERVFPKAAAKEGAASPEVPVRLVPALYPLSGITMEEIPTTLPALGKPVDAAMASASLRFMLRLAPDGSVSACDDLSDDPGGKALSGWLRTVKFPPATAARSQWISLGVGFVNLPVP